MTLYKKIMFAANRFYNEGLDKASVRDLSGAITSLRESLKLNKNNIEGRNLLGRVYYERGEVVAALSEWVISKNLKGEDNIADSYINELQSNKNRLDTINQTIRKYNQSVLYCREDNEDMAIIQLKKVEHFDLTITGTILVRLSDGSTTYVSRRYVGRIKQMLGV